MTWRTPARSQSFAAALVVAVFSIGPPPIPRPALAAQSGATSKPVPLSRLDRLEAWVAAVEQHQAGVADAPLLAVKAWAVAELQQTGIDLSSLVSLIRDPRLDVFFYTDPPRPVARSQETLRNVTTARRRQIFYSKSELMRLRALAKPMTGIGGDNRLLKRGALLHFDIGMLPPSERRSARGTAPGPQGFTLELADGQPLGSDDVVSHWEIGRRLLDKVSPNPSLDADVRLWYLAASAFMQGVQQIDLAHFSGL